MKKTYKSPAMDIIKMESSAPLLDLSINLGSAGKGDDTTEWGAKERINGEDDEIW